MTEPRSDLWTWPESVVQREPVTPPAGHVAIGLDCWCRPYPDPEVPSVIVHRREVPA